MSDLGDDLKRRSERFRAVRQAGLAERRSPPEEEGISLGVIEAGLGKQLRMIWATPPDRAPELRVRLWVDEGFGFYPVRRVGVSVPFMDLDLFGKAVARALDLAIDHQQAQRNRGGRW
jgi:hypothetical protein